MSPSGAERRLDRRLGASLRVSVNDKGAASGRLSNVSAGGAAVMLDRAPQTPIGDTLSFRIEEGVSAGLVLEGELLAVTSLADRVPHLLHVRFGTLNAAERAGLAALMDTLIPQEPGASGLPRLRGAGGRYSETEVDAFFVALRRPGDK